MPDGPATPLATLAAWILYPTGSAVILTTLLPMVRRGWWWLRIWDFPRPQNAVIGPLVFVAGCLVLPGSATAWVFLGALGTVSAYQVWRVWPFTPFAPKQMLDATGDEPTRRLRILVTNVEVSNREAGPVLDAVRASEPDLWLALEPDDWWCERLRRLDPLFGHGVDRPQDNAYGLMFRSRLPVRDLDVEELVEPGVPSLRARVQLRCGDWVAFHGLHPRPPHTFQASFSRDGELMIAARGIAGRDVATVVAGDFNDAPWSRSCRMFQKISRLLDPRLGRGLFNTFNARRRISRWPLDHVFASEHFRLVRIEALPPVGSDHHPLLVDLSYEPEGAAEQAPRAMQEADHSAAETLLRRGDRVG